MSPWEDASQRIGLRALTCVLATLLLGGCSSEPAELPAPLRHLRENLPGREGVNVIIVSFDALRPDALGAYGYGRPVSPSIDAFAARGLRFERAFSTAPVTPTSFAAAFSGFLPVRVFQRSRFVVGTTLAEHFSAGGYVTAAFVNNVQLAPERGFDKGFAAYEWTRNDSDEKMLGRVLGWLREHRWKRIFLWVHFLRPHAPYRFREDSRRFYDSSYEGPFETTTRGQFEATEPREIARIRDLYDGEVFFSDRLFGDLADGLERLELFDDSVVVLTSDHGEEFYEHGGFQHGRLFQEHLRIPLVIYHPDVRHGAATSVLYRNVDLMPTLLGLTGLEVPEGLDGANLLAVERSPEKVVGISMTGGKQRYLSFQNGNSKLILGCIPEVSLSLFDLVSDPGETMNLVDAQPKLARKLNKQLTRVLGGEPCEIMEQARRGALPTAGLDADSIEALKALGYPGD